MPSPNPLIEPKPDAASPRRGADLFETGHLLSDLRARSVRGGAITLGVEVCQFVLQMVSTMVLARLLTPADYGLIAMVSAVTGFLSMFSNLGLSTATIQKAEINHDQVSTLFWINVGLGVLVALVVVALAPAVAWFYGDSRLTWITMALGAGFIFAGLSVQHQALLTRQMRYLTIGIVGIVSMTIGITAGIAAALSGAGYWSLVVLSLVTALSRVLGKWIVLPWMPGRPKRGVGVRAMLGFGGNITAFNIVNYFSRKADDILIGKAWGSTELGFYNKAYSLLMMPLSQLRGPLMSVAMPSLSRLQTQPERFRSYYLKMLQVLAFLSMPLAAFLGAFSHDIVLLVLGPQWGEAATIFTILAFVAVLQPMASTVGTVLVTLGQTGKHLRLGVVVAALCVVSFVVGLPWGARGVALSYTLFGYATLIPYLHFALKETPVSLRDFLKVFAMPMPATIGMVLAGKGIAYLCSDFPSIVTLLLASASGGLVYLGVIWIQPGGSEVLEDLRTNLRLILKPATRQPDLKQNHSTDPPDR